MIRGVGWIIAAVFLSGMIHVCTAQLPESSEILGGVFYNKYAQGLSPSNLRNNANTAECRLRLRCTNEGRQGGTNCMNPGRRTGRPTTTDKCGEECANIEECYGFFFNVGNGENFRPECYIMAPQEDTAALDVRSACGNLDLSFIEGTTTLENGFWYERGEAVPTVPPTESPTFTPTPFPTGSPTRFPTTAPPTRFPTERPTRSPTRFPTIRPTSPTRFPTERATRSPTRFPTTAPPTRFPTRRPTAPTPVPSPSPTRFPTPRPTSLPPTERLTRSPTTFPTRAPIAPTPAPSPRPTQFPTPRPTLIAVTASPSSAPTPAPTTFGCPAGFFLRGGTRETECLPCLPGHFCPSRTTEDVMRSQLQCDTAGGFSAAAGLCSPEQCSPQPLPTNIDIAQQPGVVRTRRGELLNRGCVIGRSAVRSIDGVQYDVHSQSFSPLNLRGDDAGTPQCNLRTRCTVGGRAGGENCMTGRFRDDVPTTEEVCSSRCSQIDGCYGFLFNRGNGENFRPECYIMAPSTGVAATNAGACGELGAAFIANTNTLENSNWFERSDRAAVATSQWQPCPSGTKNNEQGSGSSAACEPCGSRSNFCPEGSVTSSDAQAGFKTVNETITNGACTTSCTAEVRCDPGKICVGGEETSKPQGFYETGVGEEKTFEFQVRGELLPCEVGHFCTGGRREPCQQGQLCNRAGLARAERCPAGSFCPDPTTIEPCPVGLKCEAGRTEPEPCPAGQTGVSGDGFSTCQPCENGKPVVCLVFASANDTVCQDCLPGRVSRLNAERCEDCPLGQWENENECEGCPQGKAGEEPGLSTAECSKTCDPGTFAGGFAVQCTQCDRGKIAPERGSADCKSCPPLSTTGGRFGNQRCVCQKGFYYRSTYEDKEINETADCSPCTSGMDCDRSGTTLDFMSLRKGFWRPNLDTDVVFECPFKDACEGVVAGNQRQAIDRIRQRREQQRRRRPRTDPEDEDDTSINSTLLGCKEGNTDVLCAVCDEGYYRPSQHSPCEICGSKGAAIGTAVGFLIVALVSLLLFIYVNRRAPNGLLRPFINLVQNLTVMLLFNAPFPESLIKLYRLFSGISIGVEVVSPKCAGTLNDYYAELAITIFALALICFALLVPVMWHSWTDKLRAAGKDARSLSVNTKERLKLGIMQRLLSTDKGRVAMRDMFVVILLVHPSLSGKAMQFFRCHNIENNYHLVADYSLLCYDGRWYGYLVFVLLVILVFSLGTPLAIAAILYKNRNDLYNADATVRKQPLDILYAVYKKEAYWFEAVQMTFKLALWSTLVIFEYGSEMQLATALVVNVLYLCVQVKISPMGGKDAELLNNLQTGTLVITTYINFGGLALNYLQVSKDLATIRTPDKCEPNDCEKYDSPIEYMETIMQLLTFMLLLTFGGVILKKVYFKANAMEKQLLKHISSGGSNGADDSHRKEEAIRGNNFFGRLRFAASSNDSGALKLDAAMRQDVAVSAGATPSPRAPNTMTTNPMVISHGNSAQLPAAPPPPPANNATLPAGWREVDSGDGRTYFVNMETSETSWIRPTAM